MTADLLQVEKLSRSFGGLLALQNVPLSVQRGEILGLIGPNGAGKSTLFNCLSGHLRATRGRILFDGRDVTGLSAARRARLGIGRTFQLGKVFSAMTVWENVVAGLGIRHYGSFARSAFRLSTRGPHLEEAERLLERLHLTEHRKTRATQLPMGIQRRVEVARALATEPKLLLLDEPAAGLTHGEAEDFATTVRRIRDSGVTVIVIEHNMAFAMRLADRVSVLVEGRVIAEGEPGEIREHPEVIAAYLGT